jgi:hypothetical protein
MPIIITDLGELKERWLHEASLLHEARGCGNNRERNEWACADSRVGCAATVFARMKREGQPMDKMIAWDKLQNGIAP